MLHFFEKALPHMMHSKTTLPPASPAPLVFIPAKPPREPSTDGPSLCRLRPTIARSRGIRFETYPKMIFFLTFDVKSLTIKS
jgi:hypothetical protein